MAPLSQPGQQQRWLAVAAGGKPRAKRNAAAAGAAAAGRKDATVVERAAVPDRPPTAVVLLNLGGPGSQEEVYPFLRRLFADKEIIPLGPLQSKPWGGIGRFIANRRTPSIQAQYREMDTGGGSPIKFWTESQGAEMVKHLDQISPDTAPHKYYISFRYASPLTEDALQEMDKDGVTRAVAFTQYPQFSCATTGSSLNELWRQLRDQGMMNRFDWSVVDRWPTHPGLIKVRTAAVPMENPSCSCKLTTATGADQRHSRRTSRRGWSSSSRRSGTTWCCSTGAHSSNPY